MQEQRKIFIVSNRLPISISRDSGGSPDVQMSSGGLVAGLREIHDHANSQWIGYLGPETNSKTSKSLTASLNEKRLLAVPIAKKLYFDYYNGYSNGVLWPLFHNFLATMSISDANWDAYTRVNRIFADYILKLVDDDSLVWVHDYQLMLLPKFLREQKPNLKIAYFHHIPFPSSEIFRTIPGRRELITGLLGADYIGFHTFDYSRHFLQSVQRLVGIPTKVNEVIYQERPIKVATHPLGVDFKNLAEVSENIPDPELHLGSLATKQKIQFLGIDRLDYTKGIPERLQSFREFLRTNPDMQSKATLIQVCVPSRTDIGSYSKIRAQVERLVGQINGEFSGPNYTPVQYIFRSLDFNEVVRLYKQSDVALVTPLRDGLNLVCKEFIASKTHLDGVLILSEFAGAASEMGEALQVNPYDVTQMSRVMKQALQMSYEERRQRVKALRERLKIHDNIAWAKNFIEGWQEHLERSVLDSQELDGEHERILFETLNTKRRIFLFLDYDGTLVPIVQRPEMAVPDARLDRLLGSLKNQANLITAIVTGRPKDFCDLYLSKHGLDIVAEHGAFLKHAKNTTWEQPFQVPSEEITKFKPEILRLLDMSVQSVPGSHIEEKQTCIVWHYREAEPKFAASHAQALAESLQHMLAKTSLSVFHGKKTLEIRLTLAHKGYGVEYLLEHYQFNQEHDALITVGDDTTDEDMHRAYAQVNTSIHIGKSNAYSKFYLPEQDELAPFLSRLRRSISRSYYLAPSQPRMHPAP